MRLPSTLGSIWAKLIVGAMPLQIGIPVGATFEVVRIVSRVCYQRRHESRERIECNLKDHEDNDGTMAAATVSGSLRLTTISEGRVMTVMIRSWPGLETHFSLVGGVSATLVL